MEENQLDKRFQYQAWNEQESFNLVKQSYLIFSNHLNQFVKNMTNGMENKIAQRMQFFTKQFTDAISPTNMAYLNPEVLAKTIETNGTNLINGMQQFFKDMQAGVGRFNITDLDAFKIGENIACTSGKVIYQNAIMQLIQYNATTESLHSFPLLIIPPWINKYYILDLQQENSLVKWLVDQGITVFMISWVNADEKHREKHFSDYLLEGPLTALNVIQQTTHATNVNLLGYCIGGTLLGCLLAYLTKNNHPLQINSATFLTTLFDFSHPGDLGVFIDDTQLTSLEKDMESKGYMDGHLMAAVFNLLRANDLIWSSFVNHYLKGEQPKPFDLLYWNADPTNIPVNVHRFYLRNMYLENRLIQPDALSLADITLNLKNIRVPSYFLATQEDHIALWPSVYNSSHHYGGSVKFVLATSGHVAGIVNPPHRHKYGYWTHAQHPETSEAYLSTATFTPGSWWNDWMTWLKNYSGEYKPANTFNHHAPSMIEAAPGAYVKVRLK